MFSVKNYIDYIQNKCYDSYCNLGYSLSYNILIRSSGTVHTFRGKIWWIIKMFTMFKIAFIIVSPQVLSVLYFNTKNTHQIDFVIQIFKFVHVFQLLTRIIRTCKKRRYRSKYCGTKFKSTPCWAHKMQCSLTRACICKSSDILGWHKLIFS